MGVEVVFTGWFKEPPALARRYWTTNVAFLRLLAIEVDPPARTACLARAREALRAASSKKCQSLCFFHVTFDIDTQREFRESQFSCQQRSRQRPVFDRRDPLRCFRSWKREGRTTGRQKILNRCERQSLAARARNGL